jgi:hypothetical protein
MRTSVLKIETLKDCGSASDNNRTDYSSRC